MSNTNRSPQEHVIDDAEILVLVGDQTSNFVYANASYLRACGYDWDELKGTPTQKMLHRENPPQVLRDMILTLRAKRPWTGIIKNCRKNGDHYWLRLNLSPVFLDGKFAGSLMVHSKPGREEIARIEPLYREMLDPKNKNLILRHGRVFRANAWGLTSQWVRERGLKGRIWGAMGVVVLAGAGGLIAGGAPAASPSFWAPALAMLTSAAVIGAFLARTIVNPLREAGMLVNRIAAGDLSSQLVSHRSDEIGEVMRGLTQMNMNIRATVLDVREGVDVMSRATAEIASGTLDLSSRTENQASNLQQTAASMEEMNVTVRSNSDTAREASQMAATACAAAETGGRVVGEVIDTMNVISKSSKQISEIIGVIDSIAFQTNILALNAAVEAARAGEQGRGFAVVASEVRSLAQRSAQSAKEIRALISESVSTVENGSKLVNAAGSTIDDVVKQARRVTELVSEIASASTEQASGIGQINHAVTELDHMTQQNAALVEQSTASAASLSEQASRLVDVIGVFKLSSRETAHHAGRLGEQELAAARARTARAAGLPA